MSSRRLQVSHATRRLVLPSVRRALVALGLVMASLSAPVQATEIVIRFAGSSSDFDPIPVGEIVIENNDIGLVVPSNACGVRLHKHNQLWDEPWGFHEIAAGNVGGYMDNLYGNGASAEYLQVNGPIGGCNTGLYVFQTPATADSPTFFPPGSGSIVMQVSSASDIEWVTQSGDFEPAEVPESEDPMSIEEMCEEVPEFCQWHDPDLSICIEFGIAEESCESESDFTGMLVNYFTAAGGHAKVGGGLIGGGRKSFAAGQYTVAADWLRRAKVEIDTASARATTAKQYENRLMARVSTLQPTSVTTSRLAGLQAARAGFEQSIASCRRQVEGMLRSIRTQTATKFVAAQRQCAIAFDQSEVVAEHVKILRAVNLPRLIRR